MNNSNTISQEDLEQMESFLAGKMPQPEHDAFKARMETDPALQEARLLITGVMQAALTENLDAFHSTATGTVRSITPVKKMRTRWMAAAATVSAIALAAVFMFKGSDDEKLAASYFEADPGLPTAMGATENYAFSRGMVDYKMGKYSEAIETWRPLVQASPANDTLNYFSGVAFLALQKTDSATHYLRQTWNNNASSFRADAGWYLALALLSEGKKTEARSLLQQTNHPKKDELLSRIK